MKFRIFFCLAFYAAVACSAQRLEVKTFRRVPGDSVQAPRKARHYIGVQANALLNQLFSFGNSSPATNNPYLLTYAVNSTSNGWGLNTGFGYTVNKTDEDSNPNTSIENSISHFTMRVGVEHKSMIAKRWMLSAGFDLLDDEQSTTSKTTNHFQFDFNSTDLTISTSAFGMGPRFALNYLVSDRLLLGTEATYYLQWIKLNSKTTNSSSSTVFDPNTGASSHVVNTSSTESSQKNKDLSFRAPITLFLIVRF